MKFSISVVLLSLTVSSLARPLKFQYQRHTTRDVDSSLIPEFGAEAGVNPDGTGNCDGAVDGTNGTPIQVPCTCPPDRDLFITDVNANVAAGFVVNNTGIAVTFPTDNSTASQLARINTALVTLQNLFGAGVGCPASSTTFLAQQKAIEAGDSTSASASTTAAATHNSKSASSTTKAASTTVSAAATATASSAGKASTKVSRTSTSVAATASSSSTASANGKASAAEVEALAPSLGFSAGLDPDGTGNCAGAVNGSNGKPIAVPCTCPPDNSTYIAALQTNVAAGFAVNNTGVSISFPTDDSSASLADRINAALITLQNLHGAGVGCPASSTTLSAQLKAAQAAA